jgi:hypothetical protein
MSVWQADFYRRPLKNEQGQPLWELFLCDAQGEFRYADFCPQGSANSEWLQSQLESFDVQQRPEALHVFRPASLPLLQAAAEPLGISVVPTRHTAMLKQLLRERLFFYRQSSEYTGEEYDPLAVERPAPVPVPEHLWGDRWRFANLKAGVIEDLFRDRPMPFKSMPEEFLPVNLKLASTIAVPGVVIDGGRNSKRLGYWLTEQNPVRIDYIPGQPDGLVLETGLADRWILATFEDKEVTDAGHLYQQRLLQSRGLHFLLVQPDNSGMTYTGFWLLLREN